MAKEKIDEPIHVGQRIKELASKRGFNAETMAHWFNCERSNMYAKLKLRDWKMSEILIASGHLNVAPYMIISNDGNLNSTAVFNSSGEFSIIEELKAENQRLVKENSELKDKIIKLLEKNS